MKVEFIVNTDINDGVRFLLKNQNLEKQITTKKSIIVLHLQLIVYLLFMAILMILFMKMNTKRYCLV